VFATAQNATKLRVPQNPNFLLGFGDPTNFMRLSLMKAGHGSWVVQRIGNSGPLHSLQRVGYATFEDPTLRKKREGWGTRSFVAVRKTSMVAPWVGEAGGGLTKNKTGSTTK
jgi:hypothetical protein